MRASRLPRVRLTKTFGAFGHLLSTRQRRTPVSVMSQARMYDRTWRLPEESVSVRVFYPVRQQISRQALTSPQGNVWNLVNIGVWEDSSQSQVWRSIRAQAQAEIISDASNVTG